MITSTKNPRIVDARKLTQRKHRLRQNRFFVEGLQLLTMAVQATVVYPQKIIPLDVFYSEALFTGKTAPRLLNQLTEAGASTIPVAPHVLDTLSERDTSQGIIATFALREVEWSLEELEPLISKPFNLQTTQSPGEASNLPSPTLRVPTSQPPNLLLILDQLQDPGNLGTLIRTADAAGVTAVMLLAPCVDPFDPKTVRGTMGSLFNLPFLRIEQPEILFAKLSEWGYRLVGADAARGRSPWQSDVLAGPVALVLGNEARGLNPALHRHLTDYVRLPLRGKAESLNVAVAGGVLMYEWLRVNQKS
jgi:TrmH family RNA methyltransferase